MKDLPKDRLLELLADQTIFGLNAEELVELETLKRQFPEWEKDFTLELTAAAIGLSNLDTSDDLPTELRARIFANADEFFAPKKEQKEVINFVPQTGKTPDSSKIENLGVAAATDIEPKRPFWHWLGWGLAAATCIAIALGLWLARDRNQPEIVRTPETAGTPESAKTPEIVRTPEIAQTTPGPVKTPEAAASPETVRTPETTETPETAQTPRTTRTPESARTPEVVRTPAPIRTPAPVRTPATELTTVQRREQLIASAPDLIRTNWASPKGDQRFSGDVVWSNAQQTGYVRLRAMPVLNPDETYQLWIIDDEREKTPVSAGLFTVNSAGEIIVPLNAELRIIKPKQFAISKEKAGGVEVTKPDRIVAVAKI